MTAAQATTVVYDVEDLSSWVGAGLTLAAVVAALLVAAQDRRTARREAAERWEVEQLTRLAVLAAHGGIPDGSSAEVRGQEAERGAKRLVLRWMLGGPNRFPLGLHADQIEVADLAGLRQLRDNAAADAWVRQRSESAVLAIELRTSTGGRAATSDTSEVLGPASAVGHQGHDGLVGGTKQLFSQVNRSLATKAGPPRISGVSCEWPSCTMLLRCLVRSSMRL